MKKEQKVTSKNECKINNNPIKDGWMMKNVKETYMSLPKEAIKIFYEIKKAKKEHHLENRKKYTMNLQRKIKI